MPFEPEKMAVVGSRSLEDNPAAKHKAGWIIYYAVDKHPSLTAIVSGGACGPDEWGETVAHLCSLQLIKYLPEWDKYGNSAGFKRNELIVGAADVVMAFWDGKSKGTAHDIELCKKLKKPCVLYTWDPESNDFIRTRPS